jgi:gluconolactonase
LVVVEEKLEAVVLEIPGAEGPVFDRSGRLFIVCPRRGQILRIDSGTALVHADTGGSPAGLAIDRENHLWVADMKRGILRVSPDGKHVDAVIAEFAGRPIRGCNDLAFDPWGNLYFTAPAGSSAENRVGELFFRSADGTLHQLDTGYAFSNGVAVDAFGRRAIVAETLTKLLWLYRLDAPGICREKIRFSTIDSDHAIGADGLDFDSRGWLLAANWGGKSIDAFDGDGNLCQRLPLPFHPSNLHFGGADRRDLYITEHSTNGLWKTRWPMPGQAEWGLSASDYAPGKF